MVDYNATSDEDLYGMCVAGDEGAWKYAYNYVNACIGKICYRKGWHLRDGHEEMVQVVTVHLIEYGLEMVREKNKFRSFIVTVTLNKIRDSFKRPRMYSLDEPMRTKNGGTVVIEVSDPKPSPEERLWTMDVISTIDNAIEKLPKRCRNRVREYLKYKLGIYENYEELSTVLMEPVPTISSSITGCLKKLASFKEITALSKYY